MISYMRALTASRPDEPLRGLTLCWFLDDCNYILCDRGGVGAGFLAATSVAAVFLLPAATAGCVRAGGGCQPSEPVSVAGQRRRWRGWPSDVQPPQQGWSPRESRCSTQRSRPRHRPIVSARPAPSCWPRGPCHGEPHHPHSTLLLLFRISALRPAG